MLKYNLKDLTKAYENGIVNKAYQGLTKGGYQWVDIDSFESITLQEQLTCCGLRFSVDDYMNAEGDKPSWYFTEICEIDGQRKGGDFRIKNDELVLILDEWGGYCGEDEEGQDTYLELGRWHRGETVELRSDTLTVRWDMNIDEMYNIPWKCYIDRKGTGRVVYQRVRTPMYRKQSGETYCVGFDKMVEEYSQVSFDDGQTWTTTATTEVLVEHNSEDCGYIDYEKRYLTFTAQDDCVFTLSGRSGYYSLDSGATWVSHAIGASTPTVQAGKKIMWKETVEGMLADSGTFSSTGRFTIEGNLMSMLYGDSFYGKKVVYERSFENMFSGCTGLTSAENIKLPATTLNNYCYHNLFRGCTNLTKVPTDMLPAATLKTGCYNQMFYGCTRLQNAPDLPARVLVDFCYGSMFYGCSRINKITCLATSGIENTNTTIWLSNTSSTGTFYAKAGANWSTGTSGIPSGWTRVNI